MTELACAQGQMVGPFLGLGLPYPGDGDLVGAGHPQAVRLHGTVFARGLLNRLFTRAYLPIEPGRRATLLWVAENDRAGYRFDIHLQGSSETVFLAYWSER